MHEVNFGITFPFLLKKLRRIINYLVWLTVGLCLAAMVMVRVPVVQSALGTAVASAISNKFGTPVSVGRVDVGIFNRIIIDDVAILDKRGKRMLWASRLSAKFSYTDLARGKITITSVACALILGILTNVLVSIWSKKNSAGEEAPAAE